MLGIDDNDYLIEVSKGKIQRIAEGLTANDFGFDFALRAPSDSWAKFSQPIPPPTFNDIWAMAHPLHSHMRIEGNTLPVLAEPAGTHPHALADAERLGERQETHDEHA